MSYGNQIACEELALIISLCQAADETGHVFPMSSLKHFISGLVCAGGSTFILCL